jgi:hypothetical protein
VLILMRRHCRRRIADGPGVTVVPSLVLLSLSRCCQCRRRSGAAAALTIAWSPLQPLLLVPPPSPLGAAGADAAAAVFVGLLSSLLLLIIRAGVGIDVWPVQLENMKREKKRKTHHISEPKSGVGAGTWASAMLLLLLLALLLWLFLLGYHFPLSLIQH